MSAAGLPNRQGNSSDVAADFRIRARTAAVFSGESPPGSVREHRSHRSKDTANIGNMLITTVEYKKAASTTLAVEAASYERSQIN